MMLRRMLDRLGARGQPARAGALPTGAGAGALPTGAGAGALPTGASAGAALQGASAGAALQGASAGAALAVEAGVTRGPWRALARRYLEVQLFWNPIVTGLAMLWLSGGAFGAVFPIALLVAAVASSVSFVPVVLGVLAERASLARGRRATPHGRAWYFALALLGMPLGLLLASRATERVFGVAVPNSAQDYRFGAFIGTLIAGLFFAWQTLNDARQAALAAQLRAERAERLELEAQLAALSAQLDPHLLFNALNTIAALIPSDAGRAEETVLRLAEMYRGLLSASRRREHPLENELDICRAYLDIERARFAERLQVSLEVAAGLDLRSTLVPVLILQPLVENAVTHGLSDRKRGGSLRIEVRSTRGELELEVIDDGVGLGNSSRRGSGLGVETTRQRLRLRYGNAAALELTKVASGGTRALLRLPLLNA
jgi:signal transduction histidine kinase